MFLLKIKVFIYRLLILAKILRFNRVLKKLILNNKIDEFILLTNSFIDKSNENVSIWMSRLYLVVYFILDEELKRIEFLEHIFYLYNKNGKYYYIINEYDIKYFLNQSIYRYGDLDTYHCLMKYENLFLNDHTVYNTVIILLDYIEGKYPKDNKYKIDKNIYLEEFYKLYNNEKTKKLIYYKFDRIIDFCLHERYFKHVEYMFKNLNKELIDIDMVYNILYDMININVDNIFKYFKLLYCKFDIGSYNKILLNRSILLNNKKIFDYLLLNKNDNDLKDELLTSVINNNIYTTSKILPYIEDVSFDDNICLNSCLYNGSKIDIINMLITSNSFTIKNIKYINKLIKLLHRYNSKLLYRFLLNDYILSNLDIELKNKLIPNYKTKKIKRSYE